MKSFDVIIIGGGLVGRLMYYSLQKFCPELSVLLIDNQLANLKKTTVINYNTFRYMSSLCDRMPLHCGQINTIAVQHYDAKLEFDRSLIGYPFLGKTYNDVDLFQAFDVNFSSATVKDIAIHEDYSIVFAEDQKTGETSMFKGALIIGADGKQSIVASKYLVPRTYHQYSQRAITAILEQHSPHNNIACEIFTTQGPIATLPLDEGKKVGLVWSTSLPIDTVLPIAGYTEIEQRSVYDLYHIVSKETAKHNMVLIGNALRTMHPIAGQGFNAGARDVEELVAIIRRYLNIGYRINSDSIGNEYSKSRHINKIFFCPGIYFIEQIFRSSYTKWLTKYSLELIPDYMKKRLMYTAMGLYR